MLQSLLPIKLKEGDPSHQTVDELAEVLSHALKNEDIRNIALTGPFGSGKSSIIQTLMEEHEGMYVEIAERRKRPILENSVRNVNLLSILKDLGFISSTTPEKNGIKVNPKRK